MTDVPALISILSGLNKYNSLGGVKDSVSLNRYELPEMSK